MQRHHSILAGAHVDPSDWNHHHHSIIRGIIIISREEGTACIGREGIAVVHHVPLIATIARLKASIGGILRGTASIGSILRGSVVDKHQVEVAEHVMGEVQTHRLEHGDVLRTVPSRDVFDSDDQSSTRCP